VKESVSPFCALDSTLSVGYFVSSPMESMDEENTIFFLGIIVYIIFFLLFKGG
jgi:hypothetical protein